MGLYKQKLNPISSQFNLVPTSTIVTFKEAVANAAALPLSGNILNDGRLTNDTGHLYIWDGTAWIDSGDIIDLKWAAIDGKPTSLVADIDDAVSKRHTQGTDQGLDTGGANAVTAAQAKAGYTHSGVITGNPHQVNKTDVGLGNVDNKSEVTIITDVKADIDVADSISKKHTQNSDTLLAEGTANEISANTLIHYFNTLFLNSALTMFRVMSASALTIQKMIDGIVDEFEDETGVNTGLSTGEKYYSVDDYYTPTPTYTETDLLLHANGTDGSTNIVDETGKTVVVTGTTVELDTDQEKFGLSSIIFGGSGAVEVADDDTLDLEAADWQYDFWVRLSAWPVGAIAFFSKGTASNNQVTLYLGPPDIGFYAETNPNTGAAFYTTPMSPSLSLNTWHHMRVQRVGSTFQIFIDGVSQPLSANVPITGNLGNFASPLYIGKQCYADNMMASGMWIDEFKFSKGGIYSTSDFTPPTTEYTPSSSSDMVLIANSSDTTSVRDEARIIIFEEDVDSITINTDLKAFVSRDNGITFTEVTLVDEGGYDTTKRIVACNADISAQPSGTDMIWKIESHNAKVFKIHGVSIFWK